MEYFNKFGEHFLYTLLVAVILCPIAYGTYKYATNLNQNIEHKKEMQRLTNQKIKLEIEILKKSNGDILIYSINK